MICDYRVLICDFGLNLNCARIFSILSLEIFSSFPEFDRLEKKADSAYEAKNYPLSISCYEQAINLAADKKSEIFGRIYYDLACCYSFEPREEKSPYQPRESFQLHNTKRNKNPVPASHITTDKGFRLCKRRVPV